MKGPKCWVPSTGYRTLGYQTLGYQVWGTMVPGPEWRVPRWRHFTRSSVWGTKRNPRLEALNGTPMVGGTRRYPRLDEPNGTPRVGGCSKFFRKLQSTHCCQRAIVAACCWLPMAQIIRSWQCCRLLVDNIANGIASKFFFAFLTELGNFKQKSYWRQCHLQCCQSKICSIAKSRWFGPLSMSTILQHQFACSWNSPVLR